MKSYNYLNLQQKLCRIRKKIPALVRKRYSEKVDYDFTRIDDIYRFLTPALNKYGVNFEIYAEKPAKMDAQGNPVYLYQENGFWMYEADLTVGWVNADNPADREQTVIHVVGTHEMAEKAKGTAWTYGLKYYLFGKFNINQDGDDADYHDFREEPKEPRPAKEPPQGREKAPAGKAGQQPERAREQARAEKRTPQEAVADSVKKQAARQEAGKKEKAVERTPEKPAKPERKPLKTEFGEGKADTRKQETDRQQAESKMELESKAPEIGRAHV